MKTKITLPALSSCTFLPAMILLLSACSGGNAGSSSGSGGSADPGTTTTGGTAVINTGEYIGNIDFSNINDSATITINIEENNNVIVTSNDTGTASGSSTGSSFSASGTISFILATQTCSGFTTVNGTSSGNTLTGTVDVSSAECIENGVSTTISLSGDFTATL